MALKGQVSKLNFLLEIPRHLGIWLLADAGAFGMTLEVKDKEMTSQVQKGRFSLGSMYIPQHRVLA